MRSSRASRKDRARKAYPPSQRFEVEGFVAGIPFGGGKESHVRCSRAMLAATLSEMIAEWSERALRTG